MFDCHNIGKMVSLFQQFCFHHKTGKRTKRLSLLQLFPTQNDQEDTEATTSPVVSTTKRARGQRGHYICSCFHHNNNQDDRGHLRSQKGEGWWRLQEDKYSIISAAFPFPLRTFDTSHGIQCVQYLSPHILLLLHTQKSSTGRPYYFSKGVT